MKTRHDTKYQLKESSVRLKELTRVRDDTKRELEEKEEELALLQHVGHQQIDVEIIFSHKKIILELEQDVAGVETQLIQAKDALMTTMDKYIEEFSEERAQLKTDIEKREKELDIFRRAAHNKKNDARLMALIERKEAEVSKLRSHMTEVEIDLSHSKEEREKFCELVRGLEKSRAELERERSRVDTELKKEIAERVVRFCELITVIMSLFSLENTSVSNYHDKNISHCTFVL